MHDTVYNLCDFQRSQDSQITDSGGRPQTIGGVGKEWLQMVAMVADEGTASDWLSNSLYTAGQNANSLVQDQLSGSLTPARFLSILHCTTLIGCGVF
jgi:hypothetical protein